jgi:hypothetical protein
MASEFIAEFKYKNKGNLLIIVSRVLPTLKCTNPSLYCLLFLVFRLNRLICIK